MKVHAYNRQPFNSEDGSPVQQALIFLREECYHTSPYFTHAATKITMSLVQAEHDLLKAVDGSRVTGKLPLPEDGRIIMLLSQKLGEQVLTDMFIAHNEENANDIAAAFHYPETPLFTKF